MDEGPDDTIAPTLKHIADAAGVSVASVSKVLNNRGGVGDESRRRILDAAERFGYQGRAARTLQRAGVESTAFVIPAEFYSRSQFYEEVIRGVLDEAVTNSLRIDVRLVPLNPAILSSEIDVILRDMQPGALIALGVDNPVVIDRIAESGIPAVIINGMDRSMRLSCVLPDNWSAGWLATRTLLQAGHREIVHVAVAHRLSMQRRLEGFRIALQEAGIPFDVDRHLFDLEALGFGEHDTQHAMRAALDQGRFAKTSAFFCATDLVAVGVMQALADRDLSVPDDYSIIGMDDIAIARHSRPPLSTIRIDRAELGRAGVQLLMERISDPEANVRRVNLGVRLIERSSIGAPKL
ncbi:LacI family DNA-binding transcriptional regulator [Rhizobium terrae]|uniref:LacI family DNA-binding transcriptional regulator n=1 Tax=Rhizobium terrae TaxID=2171756 RepID=UPI000E3DEDDA|nr:LacI family DNA-binding transcriptional regulator [Rhizobium terrae]